MPGTLPLQLMAKVYWLTADEGGLATQEPFPGMRSSFLARGDLIASIVTPRDDSLVMKRGSESEALIVLPYARDFDYDKAIEPGYVFTLQVGGKIIGRGSVTAVLPG